MPTQLMEISTTAIISCTQSQISSELGGEAVILNLDSGIYYGLNEVGARIWELIQKPRGFSELHSVLMKEYNVSSETCKQDLKKILIELEHARLVEVNDETP